MSLVKVMPVLSVYRQLDISDKRLWRSMHHNVGCMIVELELSRETAVGVDELSSRRCQRYVTVFLDMWRQQEPVTLRPGHGKGTITPFSAFLAGQSGEPDNVIEVVCDMSQTFPEQVTENLSNAEVTVDWFHIVKNFTKVLDAVRRKDHREKGHLKALR
ncbi:MAG: transposase [Halomonas sp.]|uniref:transposase n=1 Tax=Halomonas sp. TaxID=1486246 RepID=UPI002ACD372D|nr:transposase [Halomonas sp.]MDZ7854081.1 transposase [Halomonas sp.]